MSGGTPHRQGDDRTPEDLLWEKVVRYGFYAVKHNWTPDQVDDLPDYFARRLPDYHEMLDEIHNQESERSNRVNRAHGS